MRNVIFCPPLFQSIIQQKCKKKKKKIETTNTRCFLLSINYSMRDDSPNNKCIVVCERKAFIAKLQFFYCHQCKSHLHSLVGTTISITFRKQLLDTSHLNLQQLSSGGCSKDEAGTYKHALNSACTPTIILQERQDKRRKCDRRKYETMYIR